MSTALHVTLPPLRQGDRLTRDEFLRRWEAMPDLKRAELINGIVYMPSPVALDHSDFDNPVNTWLGNYAAATPGCWAGANGTWLMEQDAPQPDISLRILPEYGGQSTVQGKFPAGAPELVVEISSTSLSRDQGPKLRLYERAGVREYLIMMATRKEVAWRELAGERYQMIAPDSDGLLRSRLFPGLWLDAAALWRRDLPGVQAALQQGLASREHAEFVWKLAAQKR